MTTRYLIGDCRDVLKTLPEESVHCVVTSPPYWGLRDYGTATWEEGDAACDHRIWGHAEGKPTPGGRGGSMPKQEVVQRAQCGKCGARRIDSQIGLEPDFNAYIATMVEVFREVRRVLRSDGTLWLNLGDSYASSVNGRKAADIIDDDRTFRDKPFGTVIPGLFKPKDLCGIPWRVAFALQSDGWWLRQDIIWAKPNPMPESVTDRCTKAHEYLFLMSKSARYYYDADAIREPISGTTIDRWGGVPERRGPNGLDTVAHSLPTGEARTLGANPDGRNKRSVWEIATAPFSEAHFATFPPALIEPCIKAGCPKGGTVLDPFGGAGTTGLVADRLGRNAILIELNPEYAAMAERRIFDDSPLFAEAAE
jgi:DNA modification methylase